MLRILFFLEQIFMVWMLVDAIRRRSEYYWYLIIILPFGEWYYFFTVKIHDPSMKRVKAAISFPRQRPLTVDQLRYRVQETPSLANKLLLGQALHDEELYDEAIKVFEGLLRRDGTQKDAVLGLGLCHLRRGEHELAIARFRDLVELDRAAFDYDPWTYLARAKWELGRHEEAAATLRDLVQLSPRLRHRIALAKVLALDEHQDEARLELEAALEQHRHAPRFLQRRDRSLARQAKALLKQLG